LNQSQSKTVLLLILTIAPLAVGVTLIHGMLQNAVGLSPQQLTHLHEKVELVLFVCSSLSAVTAIATALYLRSHIFRPLTKLSNRMMDFLIDKYSFKFTIPDNTEVGDLQRTFNSLAQRVLNHMEELKQLDSAKSEFLSIASHELRTPMTSIKGSLGLLKSGITGKLDPAGIHLIDIAEKETDRLIRLINDLLDLAKIEANSVQFDKKWSSVEELIKKTLQSLEGLASAAGVHFELVTPEISPLALIDTDRMQQVLNNLISNALKFSPKGSKITVKLLASAERGLRIEVIDQGPGIDLDVQERIFEKFSQGTCPQNPLVAGTGLGLTIAKAITEQHEGEITVKSRPGRGATFTVSLKHWKWPEGEPNLPAEKAEVHQMYPQSSHGSMEDTIKGAAA
jgi:signal transduction histidine kinase